MIVLRAEPTTDNIKKHKTATTVTIIQGAILRNEFTCKSYTEVTNFAIYIHYEVSHKLHNLRMLFLAVILATIYIGIHIGAKRAVENYDGSYGRDPFLLD